MTCYMLLLMETVYRNEDNLFLVKHLNNFEYFIIAKIFDKTKNIAQVGEF